MMKARRLCAFVLLAALALLQVRIALAGCLPSDRPAPGVAAQCWQMPGENVGRVEADANTLARLCSEHCVRAAVPQEPDSTALAPHPEGPAWTVDRSVVAHASALPEPFIRQFLTGPQVPGPRLIYYLQRLLI